MTLTDAAVALFDSGLSETQVRTELRGHESGPTCGAVETAIEAAYGRLECLHEEREAHATIDSMHRYGWCYE